MTLEKITIFLNALEIRDNLEITLQALAHTQKPFKVNLVVLISPDDLESLSILRKNNISAYLNFQNESAISIAVNDCFTEYCLILDNTTCITTPLIDVVGIFTANGFPITVASYNNGLNRSIFLNVVSLKETVNGTFPEIYTMPSDVCGSFLSTITKSGYNGQMVSNKISDEFYHGKSRIHVFSACYNENLLLPYFMRHYNKFCDQITIFDNQSDDGCLECTSAYSNVEIITFKTNNELREDILTHIKNNAWKKSIGKTDYAVIVDIDEILYHRDYNFLFRNMRKNGFTVSIAKGYAMVSESPPVGNGQIYEEIKYGVPHQPYSKPVIFSLNDIQEINYSPGCHRAAPKGTIKYLVEDPPYLLHYYHLGLEYVSLRVANRQSRFGDFMNYAWETAKWGNHYFQQIEKEYFDIFNKKIKVVP